MCAPWLQRHKSAYIRWSITRHLPHSFYTRCLPFFEKKWTVSTIHPTRRINHIWNLTPESLFKWSIINAVIGKTAIDPQGYPLLAIIQQKRHNSFSLDRFVCWNQVSLEWFFSPRFTSVVEPASLLCTSHLLALILHLFPAPPPCWRQNQLAHQSFVFLPLQLCCVFIMNWFLTAYELMLCYLIP